MTTSAIPLQFTYSQPQLHAMRIGAAAWILSAGFLLVQFLAGVNAENWSLLRDSIGFLGATNCGPLANPLTGSAVSLCSPHHTLFNSGLALFGALTVVGAVLARPFWGRSRWAGLGLWMIAAGGLGATAAGIWPVSANPALHASGFALHLLLAKLGLLLLGLGMPPRYRRLRRTAIAVALVSLAAGVLHLAGAPGLLERIALWPATLWAAGAGFAVLGALRSGWGRGADMR